LQTLNLLRYHNICTHTIASPSQLPNVIKLQTFPIITASVHCLRLTLHPNKSCTQSLTCDVCDAMLPPNITYAKNDNSIVHSSDVGQTMCKRFQNGSMNFTWRYMLCCSLEE
jgi:hypothetical protein